MVDTAVYVSAGQMPTGRLAGQKSGLVSSCGAKVQIIYEMCKLLGIKKPVVSRRPVPQKTNYLKTNLLKQIKKISVFLYFLHYIAAEKTLFLDCAAKVRRFYVTNKSFPLKMIVCAQKYYKKGMDFGIHPLICYAKFAKLYYFSLF